MYKDMVEVSCGAIHDEHFTPKENINPNGRELAVHTGTLFFIGGVSRSAVLVKSLQGPKLSPSWRQVVLKMTSTAATLVTEQAPKAARVGNELAEGSRFAGSFNLKMFNL